MGLRGIAREIAAAIEEGRVSDEPPYGRMGLEGTGDEYAWSPRRDRIYVLANRRPGSVTLVTCVCGPGDTRP